MRLTDLDTDYDVLVVGARCAGAATAMLAARAGLRVAMLDRSPHGSDTLSTHALMRGAVLQLHRWGVLDAIRAADTPVIRRTVFHYGEKTVDVEIAERDGIEGLFAPRRTVLDAVLAEAAIDAGVHVVRGVHVRDLAEDESDRIAGLAAEDPQGTTRALGARIVVGADGRSSLVARRTRAETARHTHHHTGVIYGYWKGLPNEGYHWYWEPRVSAGIIPTNDGLSCVFASMPPERFESARGDLESMYRQVLSEAGAREATASSSATRVGKLFGFPGVPGFLRRCQGPGWALVGDAGYYKDPLTAHGITDALRDAEILAAAIVEGTDGALAGYEARRNDLSVPFLEGTDRVASFGWDLDEIQRLHLTLNAEMKREVRFLRNRDLPSGRLRPGRAGAAGS